MNGFRSAMYEKVLFIFLPDSVLWNEDYYFLGIFFRLSWLKKICIFIISYQGGRSRKFALDTQKQKNRLFSS